MPSFPVIIQISKDSSVMFVESGNNLPSNISFYIIKCNATKEDFLELVKDK